MSGIECLEQGLSLKILAEKYQQSPEFTVKAVNTKETYTRYLMRILDSSSNPVLYAEGRSPMQLPVAVALNDFVRSFNGTTSQLMARQVLLILFAWGKSNGFLPVAFNPSIPRPRKTRQDKLPLKKEELPLLMEVYNSKKYPNRFKPYLAAAFLGFQTGLRPSELGALVWEDVGDEYILVRSAKAKEVGVVSRMVKITEGVKDALAFLVKRDLLARHGMVGRVFHSINGSPLNKDTRSKAIHVACKMAGIPEREFYCTRRGTATEMFKAGYDVAHIQKQLGHSNVATTMIYIKPTMQEAASYFKGF